MNCPFPVKTRISNTPCSWEGVHARLMVAIANQLQPKLDPRYVASIEERVFIEGPQRRVPDVWIQKVREADGMTALADTESDTAVIVEVDDLEIHETRVEILDSYNELKLVALIEVVSPTNKAAGPGRASYKAKQAGNACSRLPSDRDRPAQSRPPRSLHPGLAGQALQAVRFALLCQPMAIAEPFRALSAHAPAAASAPEDPARGRRPRYHRSTFRPHSSKSTSMADTGGVSATIRSANRAFRPRIRPGPTSESPPFARARPDLFPR